MGEIRRASWRRFLFKLDWSELIEVQAEFQAQGTACEKVQSSEREGVLFGDTCLFQSNMNLKGSGVRDGAGEVYESQTVQDLGRIERCNGQFSGAPTN